MKKNIIIWKKSKRSSLVEFQIVLSFKGENECSWKLKCNLLTILILTVLGAFTLMHGEHGLIQMGVFVQMWIWKVKKYLWFHVLRIYPISTWGILVPFKLLIILIALNLISIYISFIKKDSFLIFYYGKVSLHPSIPYILCRCQRCSSQVSLKMIPSSM